MKLVGMYGREIKTVTMQIQWDGSILRVSTTHFQVNNETMILLDTNSHSEWYGKRLGGQTFAQ